MTEQESRFTDPDTAVDHVRRVARETATASGHRAAAFAVMDLRREYRIMPLQQKEAPPGRRATWQAVRMETRSLVPMAMGGSTDRALFDERVATPRGRAAPPTAGLGARPVAGPAGRCAARNGARVTASQAGPLAGSRHWTGLPGLTDDTQFTTSTTPSRNHKVPPLPRRLTPPITRLVQHLIAGSSARLATRG